MRSLMNEQLGDTFKCWSCLTKWFKTEGRYDTLDEVQKYTSSIKTTNVHLVTSKTLIQILWKVSKVVLCLENAD